MVGRIGEVEMPGSCLVFLLDFGVIELERVEGGVGSASFASGSVFMRRAFLGLGDEEEEEEMW